MDSNEKISTLIIMPMIALSFMMFMVGGAYTTKWPTDNMFIKALWAAESLHDGIFPKEHLFEKPAIEEEGVIEHIPAKAMNGYTLYSSMKGLSPVLIDMEGNVVHKWDLSPAAEHFKDFFLDNTKKFLNKVKLLPNGDLLAVLVVSDKTPWGGGIVKADKDSNILWIYKDKKAHHDLSIGNKGEIYILTHNFNLPKKGEQSVLEDFVTVLSPDGKELKSFSIMEALLNSPFKTIDTNMQVEYFYDLQKGSSGFGGQQWVDSTHANTILYVTKEMAEKVDYAKEGNLLICLRNLNLLVVVDPQTESITWAKTGPWLLPHDPHILANGNILIFDNRGIWPISRVIEYDTEHSKVVWESSGPKSKPMSSKWWGRINPLENGNVLVTEPVGARLIEIAKNGEIVWLYSSPDRLVHKGENMAWNLSSGYRFKKEELTFLDK